MTANLIILHRYHIQQQNKTLHTKVQNSTNAPMVDRFRPTIRILLDTNQLDVKDQRAVCWDDWRVAFCAVCVIWCARQFSTLANAHLKEFIALDYTTPV